MGAVHSNLLNLPEILVRHSQNNRSMESLLHSEATHRHGHTFHVCCYSIIRDIDESPAAAVAQ